MKKALFGVFIFLIFVALSAGVIKACFKHDQERQQRIKREQDGYIEDVTKQCRLRHPIDNLGRAICYDDLIERRSFV